MIKSILSQVASFVNGYAFKPTDWSSNGLEIIRIQNLTKSTKEINYYPAHLSPKYLVKGGDLLISWSGTLDVFEWSGKDAWLNQHIFKVVFDKGEINKRFFFYLIKSILDDMKRQVHGATMKHITKERFDNIEVSIPPLETQHHIANLLDTADALRKKDQELLQKYDELAEAIFYDMFGDSGGNKNGWNIKKGEEVLKIVGGAAFKSSEYQKDGIPLIRIGAVNKGYFDKSQLVYLPNDFKNKYNSYLLFPGDLLITLTGTVGKDDYGNVFELGNEFEMYFLNQRVAKLVLSNYLNKTYFKFYLKQKEVKNKLTGVNRGVRQANISNGDIYNLDIMIPPIEMQKQFESIIDNISQQRDKVPLHLSEQLFNSLLHQSFSTESVNDQLLIPTT